MFCDFEVINNIFVCRVCGVEWYGDIAPVIACVGQKIKVEEKPRLSNDGARAKAAAIQRRFDNGKKPQQPLKKGCGCKGK